MFRETLAKIVNRVDLSEEEISGLITAILSGEVPDTRSPAPSSCSR